MFSDWALATKGIDAPEIVAPISAHPALSKACEYFKIKLIRTPLRHDKRYVIGVYYINYAFGNIINGKWNLTVRIL